MKFGIKHITKETPRWATWMFRIVFLLTTVAIFVIGSDEAIAASVRVRLGIYLKAFEMVIYGLSKMFGVTIESNIESNDSEQPTPPESV